jgi:hypothetical protein
VLRRKDGRFNPVAAFTRTSAAGDRSFHFAGSPAGHRLPAGRYRLRAQGKDLGGNAGPFARVGFEIVRGQ